MIASIVIWALICLLFGIAEASIFHQVTWTRPLKKPFDEHFYLWILRATVSVGVFHSYPLFLIPCLLAGLMFPFFHNTAYYVTRNLLSHGTYKSPFFADSETTDAYFSFNWYERLILLGVSLSFWWDYIKVFGL